MTPDPEPLGGVSSNPYTDPDVAVWLSSFEGIAPPAQAPAARPPTWRAGELLDQFAPLAPGLVLAGAVTALTFPLSRAIGQWVGAGGGRSPVSPILLAIVLGLAIRNTVNLPAAYDPGLRLCTRWVLRGGIVLLGLGLSLAALADIGLAAAPLVVACVAAALLAVAGIGRLLGVSPRLASLIAGGTGICGVSAIVAIAPSIDAEDDEISYAVACIALFGLIALMSYPWLAHLLFAGDAKAAGLFLGTSIHDTAQVTGAALMYEQQFSAHDTLQIATVTKLLRNLCLVAVVPLLAVLHHRRVSSGPTQGLRWGGLIPGFIVLFVVMAGVRSIGDLGDRPFGMLSPARWDRLLVTGRWAASLCLALAMASVGLNTHLARLRRLGPRPMVLGLAAAGVVSAVSVLLIKTLGFSL